MASGRDRDNSPVRDGGSQVYTERGSLFAGKGKRPREGDHGANNHHNKRHNGGRNQHGAGGPNRNRGGANGVHIP